MMRRLLLPMDYILPRKSTVDGRQGWQTLFFNLCNMNTPKRSWKEWYIIIILLIIGAMYLALQLTSMIHSYSRSSSIEGDTIRINKSELLTDIRTFITVILCLA